MADTAGDKWAGFVAAITSWSTNVAIAVDLGRQETLQL